MQIVKHPTVSAIVVTMNSALFVAKAIESLRAQDYPEIKIIVVDNLSSDGTPGLIKRDFPYVHLIETGRNMGFAGGNNIGMKAHPADYFVLLNPDAVLAPNWISIMVSCMEQDLSVAVTGAKVFYGDHTRLQHAGAMIRDNALTYHIGDGELDHGQYDTVKDVDYVLGAAMTIRRSVAQALNYLPEAYFPAYFEEADFCFQARKEGHRVLYIPAAVAYHDERFSGSGAQTLKYVRRYHRHRYLFAIRNFKSQSERAKFLHAERQWRKTSARGLGVFLLLTYCKLANWRYLPAGWWLFQVP